jgi:hypothetical protein
MLHILKVITAQPICSRREEIQSMEPVLHMLAELSVVRRMQAIRTDSIAMPATGDDLIGPRDIKRGVHLLTNAEMALLTEDAEAEEEPSLRGRRRRRDSGVLRGDKLTEGQITQVKFLQQFIAGMFPILHDLS